MNPARSTAIATLVLAAAASRFFPHPPNFTPVAALALFAGCHLRHRWAALLLPWLALFLGDLLIGLHVLMPWVYGSFAVTVLLGRWVRRSPSAGRIAIATLSGAMVFFAVTNLAVWAVLGSYPPTLAGLFACYAAGLPYLVNSLAGDVFHVVLLFGALQWAEQGFPVLREPAQPTLAA